MKTRKNRLAGIYVNSQPPPPPPPPRHIDNMWIHCKESVFDSGCPTVTQTPFLVNSFMVFSTKQAMLKVKC